MRAVCLLMQTVQTGHRNYSIHRWKWGLRTSGILKDKMSPIGSAGGVAGKEDNENPVLGLRQACLEDGNA